MEDLEQPETDSTAEDLPEVDEEVVSTDEPEQTPAESDDEEIDYEGEKYKVPKKLKDAFLRQADYTVKTQTIAEERRAFEAAQQEFVQRQQFQSQHIERIAEVKAIDHRLEQFSKLDWNALTDADPVQAMKLDREMRALQQQRGQHVAAITQAQEQAAAQTSQATARSLAEAHATLTREITGYGTPEVMKALKATAKEIGFRDEELANVNDPRAVKLLYEASQYRKLMAKAKTAEKPDVKPITRIAGATATAEKSPSAMTDAEFAKWRQRQIAQRR